MHKFIRDTAFQIARQDVALFLQEHEGELLQIFREEMQCLDDQIPEEAAFIDIKMVPLGDAILKAVVRGLVRFLTETPACAVTQAAKSPPAAAVSLPKSDRALSDKLTR